MITLEFVIPAYQEKENIADAVGSVLNASREMTDARVRILIVDDGSTDGTGLIADSLDTAHPEVRAIHQSNQGIGGALRTGIRVVQSDYFLIWPADMRLTTDLLSRIIVELPQRDAIVGYRLNRTGYSPLMKWNSRLFASLIRLCCGIPFRDVTWISVYKSSLFRDVDLRETGIGIFPEMLLVARRRGTTFAELPIEMQRRIHGKPSAARFKTMLRALFGLARLCIRFNRFRKVG